MQKSVYIGWLSSALEAQAGSLFIFLMPVIMPLFVREAPYWWGNVILLFGMCCFPLGAIVFGSIGDRWGRRPALLLSSLGIGVASLIVALVPAQWGYMSLVGLAAAYGFQVFCSGGEYNGSTIYAQEHGNEKHSSFISGISCAAAACGLLFSTCYAAFVMQRPDVTYLWRIGFMISAMGIALSAAVKWVGTETPFFERFQASHIKTAYSQNLVSFLIVTVLSSAFGTLYFTAFVVMNEHALQANEPSNTLQTVWMMGLYALCFVVGSIWVLYVDGLKWMRNTSVIGVGGLCLAYVLNVHAVLFQSLLVVLTAVFAIPIHSVTAQLAQHHSRYRMVSLAFALGWTVSGVVPFIGYTPGLYGYLIVWLILSSICIAVIKQKQSLSQKHNRANKEALVCLNGDLPPIEVFQQFEGLPVFAVDGAYHHLEAIGVKPLAVLGDGDSLGEKKTNLPAPFIELSDQNKTDFHKALIYLKKEGYGRLMVLGLNGGELDHIAYNMAMLARFSKEIELVGLEMHENRIRFVSPVRTKQVFEIPCESTVSILAYPKAVVSTKGLYWNLSKHRLFAVCQHSLRNRAIEESVTIQVHSGCVLVVGPLAVS